MAARLRTLTPHVGRIYSAIALDEGDDAMQETMIRVLSHLRSLREPAALRGWMRRIAVREALKLAQARRALVTVEHLLERPSGDVAVRVEIADTLRQLSPDQRAVLLLGDLEGFGAAAALLQVEVGTVKSRLHRARQRSAGGGRDEPMADRSAGPGPPAPRPGRGPARRRPGRTGAGRPYQRVWPVLADLEHSVPAFDPMVARLRIVSRDGERLTVATRLPLLPLALRVQVELRQGGDIRGIVRTLAARSR
jgi:DNA-directed RNA polymerase specialized sigma24 family protein